MCRTVVWPAPYLADRDGLARSLALQSAVREAVGAAGALSAGTHRRGDGGSRRSRRRSRAGGARRRILSSMAIRRAAFAEVALASFGLGRDQAATAADDVEHSSLQPRSPVPPTAN